MAEFKPTGIISQSADGKTITFTDASPIIPSQTQYRELKVYDGKGVILTTLTIPSQSMSVTFPITKDIYLSISLKWVLTGGTTYLNTINYLSTRFYDNKLLKANVDPSCSSCNKDPLSNNLIKSYLVKDTAMSYFELGIGSLSNDRVEDANTLIDSKW